MMYLLRDDIVFKLETYFPGDDVARGICGTFARALFFLPSFFSLSSEIKYFSSMPVTKEVKFRTRLFFGQRASGRVECKNTC